MKEKLLKSYYRRILVFLASYMTVVCVVAGLTGAFSDFIPRKYSAILDLVAVFIFPGALFVFGIHFRSNRRKDGVGDAEWRNYFFRQPFVLHALSFTVALLLVIFAIFKCLLHFFPNMIRVA